jgi:hypothetical protein
MVDTTITAKSVDELKGKYISEDWRIVYERSIFSSWTAENMESMHITQEQRNSTLPFELSQLAERGLKEDIDSHCYLQPSTSLCLQRSRLPDLVFVFKKHLPSFMVLRKSRKVWEDQTRIQ